MSIIKIREKRKLKLGLTLMETVLALVIGLAVIGGVLVYFNQANGRQMAVGYVEEIASINSVVHQIFENSNTYNVWSGVVTNSGLLPSKYVDGVAIIMPDKAYVELFGITPQGASNVSSYVMNIHNVSHDVCVIIPTMELTGIGSTYRGMSVNGTNYVKGANNSSLCKNDNTNMLGFIFN